MSHFHDTLGSIEELLAQVGAEEKSAEANTEAGGYQGGTTHPVKDVDDRTDDAQTGARFSENSSDVKEDQGEPGVDKTTEGTPGGQDSVQLDVGVTSKATGEDATNEDDYKPGKEDGGYEGSSSHPARTDNDSLDGHKYASLFAEAGQLFKSAEQVGKDFLAAVAVEAEGETQKQARELAQGNAKQAGAGSDNKPPQTPAANKQAAKSAYDLAGVFVGTEATDDDIKAASASVYELIGSVIDLADYRAEKTAKLYQKMAAAEAARARKKASDDEEEEGGEEEEEEGNPTEGGSEGASEGATAGASAPPAMDPAASGGDVPMEGGGGDADIMALLAGGEGMGAEDAMGGMADVPPAAPAAAMGGAGGDPAAAAMGGGGGALGGMSEEELLPLLLQLLQQDPGMMEQATDKVAAHIMQQVQGKKATSAKDEKQAQIKSALKEILGRR